MNQFLSALEPGGLRFPGLAPGYGKIARLGQTFPRELAACHYKAAVPVLWAVLIGGTGTGKSTILNALCGEEISEAGVERPKTEGPVLFIHESLSPAEGFPFPEIRVVFTGDTGKGKRTGGPGVLTVITHRREDLRFLALVDTPDVDSVEIRNRTMAEDLYLLSDVVIFVTSQEKYADEVPARYYGKILEEGKPHLFVLNKADAHMTAGEAERLFPRVAEGAERPPVFLVPRVYPAGPGDLDGLPAFRAFRSHFFEHYGEEACPAVRAAEAERARSRLAGRAFALLHALEEERRAAEDWRKNLRGLSEGTARDLLAVLESRNLEERKRHIQKEIGRIFARYDLLRGPRRFVREVFLFPLRLAGLLGWDRERRREVRKIQEKVDNTPLWNAVDQFQLAVLERLSPPDEKAPLFSALREAGVSMEREEVEARIREEQDRLAAWLEETFRELSRGIPKTKEVGIYTASVLWGGLLLSFEIVIGGGISLLEAVLGSFLAPFITKGSAELFAFQEVRKVALEMKRRYESGISSILEEQASRFERCLDGLLPDPGAMEALSALREELEA